MLEIERRVIEGIDFEGLLDQLAELARIRSLAGQENEAQEHVSRLLSEVVKLQHPAEQVLRRLVKSFPYLYTMLSSKVRRRKIKTSTLQALSDKCSSVRIRVETRSHPGGSLEASRGLS